MHKMNKILLAVIALLLFKQKTNAQVYEEVYRPQIHFSPKAHWINDPNGMIYYNGVYHLFYQYYPDASVWGPMHWGHATSTDLMHWKEQSIALYPDKIGYIFSGSVVLDKNNTSGFGIKNKPPLVAIFTQHDTAGEHAHTNTFQNQSIAYSNDAGKTWTKYKNNPVLKNPGITDFRDPKVMWYADSNKWIMTLAVKDHISFYSSHDLKNWTKESDFGKDAGAHGGVWECPDLISFDDNGKKVWALIVNLNPGGPNGGSATQYFLGDFNGKEFIPINTKIKWIDYGPDEYAGVTFSNTDDKNIFLGWMSNWTYSQLVPTQPWRGAMTLPRNLSLEHVDDEMYIASTPVVEVNSLSINTQNLNNIIVNNQTNLSQVLRDFQLPGRIDINLQEPKSFSLILSNDKNENLSIGYDDAKKVYFINRANSGEVSFQQDFGKEHSAPRISNAKNIHLVIIADASSVELFADDGLTVMTEIFFASKPYDTIRLQSNGVTINNFNYTSFKSIWQ